MHRILDESSGNVIGLRVSGMLHEEDYEAMIAVLKKRIDEYGDIHVLFEMKDFEGWTPKALWEDVKFDVKYNRQITRAAVVGDKTWEKWMTQLMKPFAYAEVRYFDQAKRDAAWDWIREDAVLAEA